MARSIIACIVALAAFLPAPAAADRCIAVAERSVPAPRVIAAGLRLAQAAKGEVVLSYVGHSTFVIRSPKGLHIATDYNDYVRPVEPPDIATMNRAHITHYSLAPDPRIRHVLRGWNPAGGPALHDLKVDDVRARNVPTNIRGAGGGTDEFGNSIFVFEVGELCIAHLGHLHHTLTAQQLGQIGRMDIVLVPVDGSLTLDLPGIMEVLENLKAPLMLPMHYFSSYTLGRFLEAAAKRFEVAQQPTPTLTVSRQSLPKRPTVIVLPGQQ